MDGLIFVGIALYLSTATVKVANKEKAITKKLEVRKNPDFKKEANAFMKLYNAIMQKEK